MYGSESTNRPSALNHGSGSTSGYGYGVSGYGNYGRPTSYGGGYGISGTLADGDEFGPGDPVFSDGNGAQHPGNIQAQKVYKRMRAHLEIKFISSSRVARSGVSPYSLNDFKTSTVCSLLPISSSLSSCVLNFKTKRR